MRFISKDSKKKEGKKTKLIKILTIKIDDHFNVEILKKTIFGFINDLSLVKSLRREFQVPRIIF